MRKQTSQIAAPLPLSVALAQDIKERTFKFALQNPKGHPLEQGATKFSELVAQRSGGKIKVNVFAGGTLGVEEACSGIRSLQSTLMMAWFLGELYHLRFATRGTLLACGVAFALFTNSLRTVFLSTLAARSGLAAAHGWHDTAGFLALGANLVLLFFLTIRFSAHQNKPPRAPARPASPASASCPSVPATGSALPFLPIARAPLLVFALALLAIFGLIDGAAFRQRGRDLFMQIGPVQRVILDNQQMPLGALRRHKTRRRRRRGRCRRG